MPTTKNPHPHDKAKLDLLALAKRKIISLRKDGTTGMSADNLWQLLANDLRTIPNLPTGTNAAWVLRQWFNDLIASDSQLRAFTA